MIPHSSRPNISGATADSTGHEALPKALWIILGVVAFVTSAGINLVEWMKEQSITYPDPTNWFNAFFVTVGKTEPASLYVLLGFCLLTLLLWTRKRPSTHFLEWGKRFSPSKIIVGLAIFTFAFSTWGTWFVAHNHALSADENMPDFQAKIFLSGQTSAAIPEELRLVAPNLKPIQAILSKDHSKWNQSYLPVYAAIRTPFVALQLQTLVNPLLGALTVICMAGVIGLLWSGQPWLSVAGASLVALTPQILVTGMTAYSMPAHLALNTLWLWLYLQPGKRRYWLAPVVGVLAIGLHSPFVHALFVTPFLVRLLFQRRWKATSIYAIIYLLGCLGCWLWWRQFSPTNANPDASVFGSNLKRILFTQPLNIVNLLSWNALPLFIPFLFALRYFRHLPVTVCDATWAFLLTFIFYSLVSFDQGFGWGNRYCYGVLGCLVLIGVAGLNEWSHRSSPQQPAQFLVVGLLLTFLVAIPLRCWQVEQFIRPFATARDSFNRMNVDLIIYDPRMAWYSSDLRRNDPLLQKRPLVANLLNLTVEQAEALRAQFPKNRFVTGEELAAYGLSTKKWSPPTP